MANVLWNLLSIIVFLVMISVLVAAHEYGHYLFARLFGMGVEEFAIGMGKKLKIWKTKTYEIPVDANYVHAEEISRGMAFEGGDRPSTATLVETAAGRVLKEETEFTVRMLPIGGFVRIKGMIPQDDGSEVNAPGGFYSKAPWKRLIVLFAGPVFSVLAGMILLIGVLLVDGKPVLDNRPVLWEIAKDGPADKAGLQMGDEIVAVNGTHYDTYYSFIKVIQANPNKNLSVDYKRGAQLLHTTVTPELAEVPDYQDPAMEERPEDVKSGGRLGTMLRMKQVPVSFGGALVEVGKIPGKAVEGILRLIRKPSRLKTETGSAITMYTTTAAATRQGLSSVILVAAWISISVGIFNLLPIPPLDGGQMLIAFAEMLRRGKRLSIQVQNLVNTTGVLAILTLAVVVLFWDALRHISDSEPKKPPAISTPQKSPPAPEPKSPASAKPQ